MAAGNKVRVSGSLYLPWVLVKSNETTESKFTAMIRVKAPPSRSNAAPIHLVVVLDVCGRMGQQRAAAPRLLDLLKTMEFIRGEFHGDAAANDQIDIVDASLMSNDHTRTIDGWISEAQAGNQENVMPKSGTGLSLVLDRAVKILDKSSDGVKRVGFIILLSDGQSKKLKSDDSCVKKLLSKYPVHVFDLGSNHDPEMLYCISKTSRGTYSSIAAAAAAAADLNNKNKNKNKLLEAVAMCLGGLKSVVAINTRVRMSVELDDRHPDRCNNIKDDIEIKIQPGGHDISGSKQGFLVGDGVLYAGEVKDLIVDIHFSTFKINSRTRSATLTATVEYEGISSPNKHAEAAATAVITAKCDDLPLLVTGTTNEPALIAYKKLEQLPPNSMVLQRMIMLEVLEMLLKFAKEHSAKKKKTATETGDLLRSTWDELKKKGGKNLQVAQKMSDLIDLREINNDMKMMASCLQQREGLSCIYSWVSSYQMQRATTTGLPLPPPFQTPAMKEAARNVSKQQQASPIMLLEELEKLFDDWDQSRGDAHESTVVAETLKFGNKVYKVVEAAINGGTRSTTTSASGSGAGDKKMPTATTTSASGSGAGDKKMPTATTTLALDDHLKDDFKSTIAIRLFDYCTIIKFKKSSSEDDLLTKICEAAEVAVHYWRRVQGRSLPAAAAQQPPHTVG